MVKKGSLNRIADMDSATEVAEFIRTKGVTRCPTACVLPTQASVAVADREALGEYATRRAERRRARVAARVQQFWSVEAVPAVR
ncbi:MAG TPA: hypothetical protein VNN75_01920 [Stellaceae bacterium]|jgi:hypothetical protein|nr:hypothetical protein [Stellaceae bacterium]